MPLSPLSSHYSGYSASRPYYGHTSGYALTNSSSASALRSKLAGKATFLGGSSNALKKATLTSGTNAKEELPCSKESKQDNKMYKSNTNDHHLTTVDENKAYFNIISNKNAKCEESNNMTFGKIKNKNEITDDKSVDISRNRQIVRVTIKREKNQDKQQAIYPDNSVKTIAQKLLEKYTIPDKKKEKSPPYVSKRRFLNANSDNDCESKVREKPPSMPKILTTNNTSSTQHKHDEGNDGDDELSGDESEVMKDKTVAAKCFARATKADTINKEFNCSDDIKDAIVAALLHPCIDIESDEEIKQLVEGTNENKCRNRISKKRKSQKAIDINLQAKRKMSDAEIGGEMIVDKLKRYVKNQVSFEKENEDDTFQERDSVDERKSGSVTHKDTHTILDKTYRSRKKGIIHINKIETEIKDSNTEAKINLTMHSAIKTSSQKGENDCDKSTTKAPLLLDDEKDTLKSRSSSKSFEPVYQNSLGRSSEQPQDAFQASYQVPGERLITQPENKVLLPPSSITKTASDGEKKENDILLCDSNVGRKEKVRKKRMTALERGEQNVALLTNNNYNFKLENTDFLKGQDEFKTKSDNLIKSDLSQLEQEKKEHLDSKKTELNYFSEVHSKRKESEKTKIELEKIDLKESCVVPVEEEVPSSNIVELEKEFENKNKLTPKFDPQESQNSNEMRISCSQEMPVNVTSKITSDKNKIKHKYNLNDDTKICHKKDKRNLILEEKPRGSFAKLKENFLRTLTDKNSDETKFKKNNALSPNIIKIKETNKCNYNIINEPEREVRDPDETLLTKKNNKEKEVQDPDETLLSKNNNKENTTNAKQINQLLSKDKNEPFVDKIGKPKLLPISNVKNSPFLDLYSTRMVLKTTVKQMTSNEEPKNDIKVNEKLKLNHKKQIDPKTKHQENTQSKKNNLKNQNENQNQNEIQKDKQIENQTVQTKVKTKATPKKKNTIKKKRLSPSSKNSVQRKASSSLKSTLKEKDDCDSGGALSPSHSADSAYGSSPSTPLPTAGALHDEKGSNKKKYSILESMADSVASLKENDIERSSTDGKESKLPSSSVTSSTECDASSSSAAASTTDEEDTETETDSSSDFDGAMGEVRAPIQTRPKYKKYGLADFHFIKVLGKGSFGKVMLAQQVNSENYFAVKCLKKDVVLEDNDVECCLIERKVLTLATKHPYLCHLLCSFQTPSHLFFVMEYLTGGDLMFHIQHAGRFDEYRGCFYAAEIISGLKYLHSKGIIYRDLKLDNILLDYQGHIRIADFGMCKLQIYLDRYADTFCGTPDYMAPEVIKGQQYNQCVDWWSFGVLMYEMMIGKSPFKGCDEDHLFWIICHEEPFYPRFLSREAQSLLKQLLDKDATRRIGPPYSPHGEIKSHSFFKYVDWSKIERKEVEAPYKPRLRHILDVQYFDRAFTKRAPSLTPLDSSILESMDQTPFREFSYTNPNITD